MQPQFPDAAVPASTTVALLERLRELDVRLWCEHGRLKCSAPRTVLTDDVVSEIRRHQTELLELLAAPSVLRPTPLQEQLWWLHHAGDAAILNEGNTFCLRGPLEPDRLQRALQMLVERHDALRMTFAADDEGRPMVRLGAAGPVCLRRVRADAQGALEVAREARRQPFDLDNGPLFRFVLIEIAPDEHWFVYVAHNIVMDGVSRAAFHDELSTLYANHGAAEKLPAPVSFAAHLREHGGGRERVAEHAEWWRQQLAGAPASLVLPTDMSSRETRGRGRRQRLEVSPELAARARQAARDHDVTPYTLLMAAFVVLLRRWSGQRDVVVGTAVSTRRDARAVGSFFSLVPLRVRLDGDATGLEVMREVRQQVLAASSHPYGAFTPASPQPPFRHTMRLLDASAPSLPGITCERQVDLDEETITRFAINLSFIEKPAAAIEIEFDADRFEPEAIARLTLHYTLVLDHLTRAPDESVDSFELLTPAEEAQLRNWNSTERDWPEPCLPQIIEERARRHPYTLVVRHGSESLTAEALQTRSNHLAARLAREGVAAGDVVAMRLERGVGWIVSALASWKLGAAFLPLDPQAPQAHVVAIVQHAGARVLISDENWPDSASGVPTLHWRQEADGRALSVRAADPDSLAYVVYSSGSTGAPKGIEVLHRGLRNVVCSLRDVMALQPGEVVLAVNAPAFDAAILEVCLALACGATLVVTDTATALDGSALLALANEQRATLLMTTPSRLGALVASGWSPTPGMRVVAGGEALPPSLARALASRCQLWNQYGPAEATICVATHAVTSCDGAVPLGGPLPNVRFYVVDEHLRRQPIGVWGELCVAGAAVARGYRNLPDETASRFCSLGNERVYRTGDRVRWRADGTLEFGGRLDDQIKVWGCRVEPAEVEAALLRHADVRQAAVVGLGADDTARLAAGIVPHGAATSTEDVAAWVRRVLPAYMVPQVIRWVQTLPLGPHGKVDRERLAVELACTEQCTEVGIAAGIEEPSTPGLVHDPATELEERIRRVWRDVLQREQVGLHDNFFDIGGHSMLLARVGRRLERELDRKIPLLKLFEHPTIADVAQWLGSA